MPVGGHPFRLLQVGGGLHAMVSVDGRYAILEPVIMDLWPDSEIRTPGELGAHRKIKFERLGLKFTDLNAYAYGAGPDTFAVFFNPAVPLPKTLWSIVDRTRKSHTYQLMPLPLTKPSWQRGVALLCAKDWAKHLCAGTTSYRPARATPGDFVSTVDCSTGQCAGQVSAAVSESGAAVVAGAYTSMANGSLPSSH